MLGRLLDDARSWLKGEGQHAEGAHLQIPVPGRCHFDAEGRLRGPVAVTYNSPFPTKNGRYGSGAMNGVVMHTMVGNLPGTVATFNDPSSQASAHFGIDQEGNVHQFGPVGKGWVAWAQVAGNDAWYSIEHADDANPDNPLTPAQIAASAQIVEALSAFAGFPLREASTPSEKGYGVHYMGGQAWGGHSCPDLPPKHIRSRQRPAILALAAEIRAGGGTVTVVSDGKLSLHAFAASCGVSASHLLRSTAVADREFPSAVAAWLNDIFAARKSAADPVPAGLEFEAPKR
jgi:hypothetical protein